VGPGIQTGLTCSSFSGAPYDPVGAAHIIPVGDKLGSASLKKNAMSDPVTCWLAPQGSDDSGSRVGEHSFPALIPKWRSVHRALH
jgi:hypothetical protein